MTVAAAAGFALRALAPADRDAVAVMTRATGVFRDDEIPVALEVFDSAVSPAGAEWYQALGAEVDGALAGWICWGPTPCTLGTYDLYWLVVDPARHGRGIGTGLLEAMERALAGRARLIVVETSGREGYRGTRAFYAARGYRETARIPGFYAPEDDQVVFTKVLASPS
ncbi:MAG: GNAT family N-acetyltransferase [Gemmatimonadales bacterium]|nr:GNAT family N-acetyltransferase [Gemmatimonadales bacterium]